MSLGLLKKRVVVGFRKQRVYYCRSCSHGQRDLEVIVNKDNLMAMSLCHTCGRMLKDCG